MKNNKKKKEEVKLENWVPASRSVSEIEKVIHGIGEKLVNLLYKKIISDERYDSPCPNEERKEKITIEYISDAGNACLILKINGFMRRYVYEFHYDYSNKVGELHEIPDTDSYEELFGGPTLDYYRRD